MSVQSDTLHWHAPRKAALTPWYSLPGWLGLARHRTGQGHRALWVAINALHRQLPLSPLESVLPTPEMILQARTVMYRRQKSAKSAADLQCRIKALEVVVNVACASQGQRASFPQLLAALAMTDGYLIQLAPGEGKTLAIAIASVLIAWAGKPLHIITANDYLAARDAELMSPLYEACGLTVAAITHETPPHGLAACYRQPIVYATAKQFLADFLRDDLLLAGARDPVRRKLWHLQNRMPDKSPVMRGLYAAIIDEADGVLIDEATTPLIIASPQPDKASMLDAIGLARQLVDTLTTPEHYTLHLKSGNSVYFTEKGKQEIATLGNRFSDYWQVAARREEIFSLAVMARDVFELNRHYIVKDGEIVIVDESTGRSMPGRSWSHGIHQSIEARQGVEFTPLTKISARMTFQEFFRHYHRLSGASGTLHGLDMELWKTFGLLILRIPPNTPTRLKNLPKQTYRTRTEKLRGFINRIEELHRKNLPVLVGTRRIMDSEEIAEILRGKGVACIVLNAKEHESEAEIVAHAGNFGCITVATNMAGRGTDIKIPAAVQTAGGLQVLMFEAHESPRIDWQLFGRSGRQGAQGTAQAYVSLEEELIVKHAPYWAKPLAASIPDQISIRLKVHFLQWLAQKSVNKVATRQRSHLAFLQKQLREQLGFSKS